ncbi:HAMP domain-containing sensor histidine kinase [Caulobacter sp. S45]|uniref:sensor histidine kinase n=1 Tax=Caulobacter sp. S45 TaxID=1641861 RepID=UPI0020B1146F|nr:HAMP domain-containing sensor histidine kinase [Caulobacter sp. S45]
MDPAERRQGRWTPPGWARRLSWPVGLSARLLLLTVLFVMLAELFSLIPALASFEEGWLSTRVRAAELASLAVEASPAGVSDHMAGELLEGAGVVSVAVQSDGVRRLLLQAPAMARFPALIDLRYTNVFDTIGAPFQVLIPGGPPMLRVVARPQFRTGDFVEIVVPAAPLRREMVAYMERLLVASVAVSVVAGLIVYLALNAFLVRPMQKITQSMERFRARPEDPEARLKLSGRRDEIGRAEAELSRMQDDLRTALHSRARLAALGEAVAKINHDLRNMLTSAQMVAERLQGSGDPRVAQALPRLERALDRAASLSQNVLEYGRSEEPAPVLRELLLAPAVQAAAADAGLDPLGVRLEMALSVDLHVRADPEQLDRILVNMFKNAREAIEGSGRETGRVRLTAEPQAHQMLIRIVDDGPGVPERMRERLFQPFSGSGRPDGSGLGLAIARELARAHGGDLELKETGPEGSVFELQLPQD